jgi:hypothetical protein
VQESARLRWIDGHYFSPVLLQFCVRENADTWENAAKQSPELRNQGR